MKRSWKEFAVVLVVCAVVAALNLGPDKTAENSPANIPDFMAAAGEPKRDLILVQWDADPELAEWCKTEIEARSNVKIVSTLDLNKMPDIGQSWDENRKQDNAEVIVEYLDKMSRDNDGKIAILGLTRKDIYLASEPKLRYIFGTHGQDHTAILSSVRMGGRFQDALFPSEKAEHRFRKMLFRYVLELNYDKPRNNNRESLLYNNVFRPRDLDGMKYRI